MGWLTKSNNKSRGQFHQSHQCVWKNAQVNQCCEKNVSTSTVRRRLKLASITETIVEEAKQCKKGSSEPSCAKTEQENSGIMSVGLMDQSSKFFDLSVAKSWWKSCNSLYHTNCKASRKLCYGMGGGLQLVGQGFVFILDNGTKHTSKLCQRYIKDKEEQHVLRLMFWSGINLTDMLVLV